MPITYSALKAELQNDPASLGLVAPYSAGNDAQCADILNAVRQTIDINRGVIPTYEVADATVQSDWTALSTAEKQRYQSILAMGLVNTASANMRAAFQQMFGPTTATRANLVALLTRKGSRAEQLFGQPVTPMDIAYARHA